MDLAPRIKEAAIGEGFSLVGICRATTPASLPRLYEWLDAGYAGEMRYMADRRDAYSHPQHVLEGVRSLVMLGWNYSTGPAPDAATGAGRVARYAWSEVDYHDLLHEKLKRLARQVQTWAPAARVRGVVDTAPLLEREFAQLAGLGWVGKNTLLIHRQAGSWFFLAALLTDLDLPSDESWTTDHCGTCRACLDACPTQAFPAPYVLDATRCISYLTIELRGPAPEPLREGLGDWVFGCDICQEVCPWNRRAPQSERPEMTPRPDLPRLELTSLFELDDESFRQLFRRTPLWRSKRRGILRNAAYVLGNQRQPTAVGALGRGLGDREPLVRGACAWGLGMIGGFESQGLLTERLGTETDEGVKEELLRAIERARQRAIALTNEHDLHTNGT
ncbi:MAG: tRNA epoxyqueuosine(34) reductase QueG [Pirellulales bacterium]